MDNLEELALRAAVAKYQELTESGEPGAELEAMRAAIEVYIVTKTDP